MSNGIRKQKITEAVLKQLPEPNFDIQTALKAWWYTQAASDNLRLTSVGNKAFVLADIEFFDVPLDIKHSAWYGFILQCGKKLKCPFYIFVNNKELEKIQPCIRLYDSKIAMLLTLYGDIYSYLDSIKER